MYELLNAYLVESDPNAWRRGVVTVRSLTALAEGREGKVLTAVHFRVLADELVEDIDVDLAVALGGIVVLDGDAVVLAEAGGMRAFHRVELGKSMKAGDLETSLESRLLVIDGSLHNGNRSHEKTGEEGEVGDVEDRDLD